MQYFFLSPKLVDVYKRQIIIDHCSASWGLDENMSIYRHVYNRDETGHGLKLPTVNITIQNSMFSEALDTYNHAFGATIGGHNSMFCRNLFASNISRNSSVDVYKRQVPHEKPGRLE